jgi:flagellar basal body-associated protein FliL
MKNKKIIIIAGAVIILSALTVFTFTYTSKSDVNGVNAETKADTAQKKDSALEKQLKILNETKVDKFDSVVK